MEELKEEEGSALLTERTLLLLERAKEDLNQLSKGDIVEMKNMKNPPVSLKFIVEGLCHLFKVKPVLQMNHTTFKKEKDYWQPGSKLVADSAFLKMLV